MEKNPGGHWNPGWGGSSKLNPWDAPVPRFNRKSSFEVLSDGDRARWDITRPAASWLFVRKRLGFFCIYLWGFHGKSKASLDVGFIGFLRLRWFLRLQNSTQKFATEDLGGSSVLKATSSGQQLDKTHRVKTTSILPSHFISKTKQLFTKAWWKMTRFYLYIVFLPSREVTYQL